MHRATPRDSSFRGYVSGGARAELHEADDTKQVQELKITMMKGETREAVEHSQNYGFTGYPVKADKESEDIIKKCAEGFAKFMGGNRSSPIIDNLDDRRFRCRNFDEGEVAMYDDQQQKVHIMRKRIYTRSPFMIMQRVIKDEKEEDGHGRDPKASRDQKKDESKRLSMIALTPEVILLERTKPKDGGGSGGGGGKQQPGEDDDYQNDEPEKEYKKDPEVELLSQGVFGEKNVTLTTFRKGKPHLMFDMDEDAELISLMTLREGRPKVEFKLDGEAGEITWGTKGDSNLTFEMNDLTKRITIQTEKGGRPQNVIELDTNTGAINITVEKKFYLRDENSQNSFELDADSGRITIKVQNRLLLGDENANRRAAYEGSITSSGDRIIGDVSNKVYITP